MGYKGFNNFSGGSRGGWTLTEVFVILAIIAVLFSMTVLPIISAHMESKTYNKLTGAHTTWWDAMWVELRVQDAPRKDTNEKP